MGEAGVGGGGRMSERTAQALYVLSLFALLLALGLGIADT